MRKLYPLKFRPIFKERIWGGRKLQELFGKDLPKGLKIGESWELADLPDDKSCIINGHFEGKNIAELINDYGQDITGDKDCATPFPLLIKLLDANDVLSVQVHPDKETCEKMGKGEPKTECWYIIDAPQGGYIYKGFKPGTTRTKFAQAIENGTTAEYLVKVEVKPGQCHFLPSGTPHAIGPGLLIAEIQQPSDTTYRVFDWNRVDAKTGKPRQLHIEEALESCHYDASGDNLSVNSEGILVEAEEFNVVKLSGKKGDKIDVNKDKMQVLVFVEGTGRITGPEDENVQYVGGDTILIPARCNCEIEMVENSTCLDCTV